MGQPGLDWSLTIFCYPICENAKESEMNSLISQRILLALYPLVLCWAPNSDEAFLTQSNCLDAYPIFTHIPPK